MRFWNFFANVFFSKGDHIKRNEISNRVKMYGEQALLKEQIEIYKLSQSYTERIQNSKNLKNALELEKEFFDFIRNRTLRDKTKP